MHVPDPVISLSVAPVDRNSEAGFSRALARFTKEDPTFRVRVDEESGETVISGMGELHLEVYLERMRREYKAQVVSSAPQVAYREALSRQSVFDYTHRKQTGGAGQFGRIAGVIEPLPEGDYEFVDQVSGGAVPRQYIPAVDKGFRSQMGKGPLIGFPLTGVRVVLQDGKSHPVDSSEMAFAEAARGAWREAVLRAGVRILEPIMRVVVEGPSDFAGTVMSSLMQRRGTIVGSQEEDAVARVEADVPLAEMFGYASTLRSATQGKATFTMEFARYLPVPQSIGEELVARKAAGRAGKGA
jgi:elongation factor G